MIRASAGTDVVHQSAQATTIVPVRGEILHVVLGYHGVDPGQHGLFGGDVLTHDLDLVGLDERPDEA